MKYRLQEVLFKDIIMIKIETTNNIKCELECETIRTAMRLLIEMYSHTTIFLEWPVFKKINTHPSYDLAIPLLDISLRKTAINIHERVCTRMLITIPFAIKQSFINIG